MHIATKVLFLLLLIGCAVLLQVYLSKQKSRIFGLILPSITLLYSIILILNMAVTKNTTALEILLSIIGVFLLSNIPTAILLTIFGSCRSGLAKKSQVEKMNVQDL